MSCDFNYSIHFLDLLVLNPIKYHAVKHTR